MESPSSPASAPVQVSRLGEHQWQAHAAEQEVGRADACRRPDGRLFVSVDAWDSAVVDRLAAAVAAGLPGPLYTVVDEADEQQVARWQRAGFTPHRRERGYRLPTDPAVTGLGAVRPPEDVTILPAGQVDAGPLSALDTVIRAQVEATVGWQAVPVQVLHRPVGAPVPHPDRFAVAVAGGEYVGLLRLGPLTRQPRIGLLAVRADHQRRGIARALLAHTLGELHRAGTPAAWTELDESNQPAITLLESAGARRAGGNLELVRT
ncbi:GNAT family N-acetyltransferase [Kitasatospora sp. NPDC006697]|uniref:GNAT family N-acetyltransferase n=1 Tax=Kitasatospora sp. NPDC006697 TaxID=3364020 RepID=UPI00369B3B5A